MAAPLVLTCIVNEKSSVHWLQCGGLVLQLFGFGTVWKQIRDALKQHHRPHPWERVTAWWKSRPGHRQNVVVNLSGMAMSSSTASGRVRVTQGTGDGSPEARMAALEHNFGELQREVDTLRTSSEKESRELKAQIEAAKVEHTTAARELTRELESLAIGSSDVQLVGLAWFIVGSIYATVPDLLVPLIRHFTS
jgi:hypothetical protein